MPASTPCMAVRKRRSAPPRTPRRARPKARPRGGFVGRDPSPVLDRYPPREGSAASPQAAPRRPAASPSPAPPPIPPGPAASSSKGPASGSGPLIRLETAFDADEFSTLLGQTSIRVTVPRGDLMEVLRRVTEFMGFGIYVYAISVRPAAEELLKGFVVELDRVEYSAGSGGWVPFVEKGVADNPFGSAPGSG
jgi:hypothetical protein